LSTLTKILIVLLTLSSIFLCGIVVTHVATANNYREQNKTLRTSLQAARQKQRSADEQSRDIAAEKQRLEARLSTEVASLSTQISQLKTDLRNIEREKTDLLQRVSSYASQVETANQTASQQTRLFENAQNELKDTTAERDQLLKEFDDTIRTLNEKLAVIAMLDADLKRLKEERAQVQAKLDGFLRDFGRETAAPAPVTPLPGKAQPVRTRPVAPVARKMELKGVITAVDLKLSVAEISIGAAQGVREGMKFYVTRGQEFICEIWIHYVDAEKAVGDLKLVQKQPRAGDSITTNL
jgi:seryl-tRNA synthetase